MYLASKQTVDDLVNNHKTIKIRSNTLAIRPLIARNKRIVLSNIPPPIANIDLERYFASIHIKPASEFTDVKTSKNDSPYNHILSFRRQVYVHPDDVKNLPDSFRITHDDTTYVVFITADTSSCFLCKKVGHVAKNCTENGAIRKSHEPIVGNSQQKTQVTPTPKVIADHENISPREENVVNNDIPSLEVTEEDIPTGQNSQEKHDESSVDEPPIVLMEHESIPKTFKRPLSVSPTLPLEPESSTSTSRDATSETASTNFPSLAESKSISKSRAKKMRAGKKETTDLPTSLMAMEAEINTNPDRYPLSSLQFINFYEKAHGNKNPRSVANEFTDDIDSLVRMLLDLHKITTDRGLKSSFTRITNKILNSISTEATTDSSEVDDQCDGEATLSQ